MDFKTLRKSFNASLTDLPPTLPEISTPGRPPVELDPRILAAYFHYGPQAISHRLAREMFGLARTGHVLHRDFCLEFGREYMRFRRSKSHNQTMKGGNG